MGTTSSFMSMTRPSLCQAARPPRAQTRLRRRCQNREPCGIDRRGQVAKVVRRGNGHAGSAGLGGGAVKAIRFDRYGPPEVLQLRDVGTPAVGDDEMLVRVRAASVNPLDWHFMRGMPYLVRVQAGLPRPKA